MNKETGLKMVASFIFALYCLVEFHRGFRTVCCVTSQFMAASTSEMSADFYQTTRRNNSGDLHLPTCLLENLKCHKEITLPTMFKPLFRMLPSGLERRVVF